MAKQSIVEKRSTIHELTAVGILEVTDNEVFVNTEDSGRVNLSFLFKSFNNDEIVIKIRTKEEE